MNVTGQHPPGVRGSTTSERERERDMRTSGQRAAPSAYVIIVAAHVVSRIFRPRIPFSILAKVATTGQSSCVRPAQNSRVQIALDASFHSKKETRLILAFRK